MYFCHMYFAVILYADFFFTNSAKSLNLAVCTQQIKRIVWFYLHWTKNLLMSTTIRPISYRPCSCTGVTTGVWTNTRDTSMWTRPVADGSKCRTHWQMFLQSKSNHTINHSWSHEQYIIYSIKIKNLLIRWKGWLCWHFDETSKIWNHKRGSFLWSRNKQR